MTDTSEGKKGSVLFGEIQKNVEELLRVTKERYRGVEFVDLRIYFFDDGKWRPSKKGVAITPDKLEEVIGLLKKARDNFYKAK